MGLFGSQSKEELAVIFDIGDGSIGGSFVLLDDAGRPTIINTIRKNFKLRDRVDSNRITNEMISTLNEVAFELERQTLRTPKHVYCVLASPWSHAELRTISLKRKTDFIFTERYAKKLIQDEIKTFKSENENLNIIIDRRTTRVSLNGYSVEKPHGQNAREVGIDVFLSLSSNALIEMIEDTIHRTFKNDVAFTSQMFSDFIVVRDIFDDLNDFMILNIGAEMSEVSIMKNDHIIGTGSFPFGKNSVIREIAQNLGKSVNETKSLFSLFKDGHLNLETNQNLVNEVEGSRLMWAEKFKSILGDLVSNRYLSHHVFMISDDSTEDWFVSILADQSFPEFTLTDNEFDVIIGNNKILNRFCKTIESVEYDPIMTMKAIFINRL